MDYLSEHHKKWLREHSEREAARKLREARLKKAMRRGDKQKRKGWGPTRFSMIRSPALLDFDENFQPTIGFIEQIRKTSVLGQRPLFVMMRPCEHLAPEVALVLAADIERCLHYRPKTINGNNPHAAVATAMLRDIGFFRLLNFNDPGEIQCEKTATNYLAIKTGVQGGGQHADALRALVLGDVATTAGQLTQNLIRGLNEAVLNVQQHAYPSDMPTAYPSLPNHRWWLAGYRNSEAKEIGFMAYDQGVGVPATTRRKGSEVVGDIIRQAAQFVKGEELTVDHLLIKRAVELGRSQTGLRSQGKGFNDFKRLITNAAGRGSLRILSGSGSFLYTHDGTELAVPLPAPFHGTLIIWRLTGSPAVIWEDEQ